MVDIDSIVSATKAGIFVSLGLVCTWAATLWLRMLLTGEVPHYRLYEYLGASGFMLLLAILLFWGVWRKEIDTKKKKALFIVFLVTFICLSWWSYILRYL